MLAVTQELRVFQGVHRGYYLMKAPQFEVGSLQTLDYSLQNINNAKRIAGDVVFKSTNWTNVMKRWKVQRVNELPDEKFARF